MNGISPVKAGRRRKEKIRQRRTFHGPKWRVTLPIETRSVHSRTRIDAIRKIVVRRNDGEWMHWTDGRGRPKPRSKHLVIFDSCAKLLGHNSLAIDIDM